MREFAKYIIGETIQTVSSLTEFWGMREESRGIFVMEHAVLELAGSIEYLRKHSLFEIKRGIEQSIESVIEKLIAFGYVHASYIGEPGSYKRE